MQRHLPELGDTLTFDDKLTVVFGDALTLALGDISDAMTPAHDLFDTLALLLELGETHSGTNGKWLYEIIISTNNSH